MAEDKIKYLEELRDKLEKSNIREFKNWTKLCELFSWKITRGTYKLAREKELSIICQWEKIGNKIKIKKINNNIQKSDIKDGRSDMIFGGYNNFKIGKNEYDNIGIYIIIDKDNNCYIGSTIQGFKQRFYDHYRKKHKSMQHTYDLLHDNYAEFRILHDMTDIEDVELIRMVEDEYIQYYKSLPQYNVINRAEKAYYKGYCKKQKYKSLKIKEEDYMLAIKILQDNNIEIKGELLDYE